jgi:uncharacterized membrane protein
MVMNVSGADAIDSWSRTAGWTALGLGKRSLDGRPPSGQVPASSRQRSSALYEVVKFIHVLCAVIWVGGAFYAQLLAIRVVRSPDPADVPKLANHIAFLATRVFIPASLLLFAAGIFMTTQRWAFQQTWISMAIVLWLVSVLTGTLYLGPRVQRIAGLFESEGPTSVAGRDLLDRVFLVARLELIVFFVTIALMVAKPNIG